MNITTLTSCISSKHHIIIELVLVLVIGFLLINSPKSTVTLPASALAEKNDLVDMRVLADGRLAVNHPETNEASIVSGDTPINQTALKQLYNVAIAVTEDSIETSKTAETSLLDAIIPAAHATKHNLPGHIYVNLTLRSQNYVECKRYDKTLNMKYVGACI